jgi:hypothetical protein
MGAWGKEEVIWGTTGRTAGCLLTNAAPAPVAVAATAVNVAAFKKLRLLTFSFSRFSFMLIPYFYLNQIPANHYTPKQSPNYQSPIYKSKNTTIPL